MSFQEYLDKMREIQSNLLDFIEDDQNADENFPALQLFFEKLSIQDNKHDLSFLFHLLTKIADNHYRGPFFFEKIEKILKLFKDDIKKYFSNSEIFNIFKGNKRVLLFLIEENIMKIDEYIYKKITTGKYAKRFYPQYFAPEILPFGKVEWPNNFNKEVENFNEKVDLFNILFFEKEEEEENELPEHFYELRKIGENENCICRLIRNDSVVEFINYLDEKR